MIASRSSGSSLTISSASCFLASSVRSSESRSVRHLDRGVAVQRRCGRDALVDFDRELRLLQRFVKIGEREQRERVVRREVQRELQVDEAEILAAAAAERGAEPVQHFGGAGLSRSHKRRQLFALLQFLHRREHDRMPRHALVELLENLQRLVQASGCATPSFPTLRQRAERRYRSCRPAPAACRLPPAGRPHRGSCRHAGP